MPKPTGGTLKATPKQVEYLDAVLSGKYNYLAIGGGIRGTKTYAVLITLFVLCKIYPRSRWAIVRKDLPTLRRNTIPSINKIKPPNFCGDMNQGTWSYACANGSEVLIFPESLATDPDLDRWKGLEVNGFVFEEANELAEKSMAKAIERAGSWIIPPDPEDPDAPVNQPIPLILLTFNPAQNWVKQTFYDRWKSGTLRPPYYFLPSTIADNPYASEAYRESLKNMPEAEYRRFVIGDWEASDDPDQLIKAEYIHRCQQSVLPLPGERRLSADIGRFGNDPSIYMRFNGNALIEWQVHKGLSIDRNAAAIAALANDPDFNVDSSGLRVDGVGLGAGVVDLLKKAGYKNMIEVIGGAPPIHRKNSIFRFANLRSQIWWEGSEKLRTGKVALPDELPELLVSDLTAVRYMIGADKVIKLETKEELKDRLGRSTDYGDAFMMGLFDFPPPSAPPVMPPSVSRVTLR